MAKKETKVTPKAKKEVKATVKAEPKAKTKAKTDFERGYDDGYAEGLKASLNITKLPKKSDCVILTFKKGTHLCSWQNWYDFVRNKFKDSLVIGLPEDLVNLSIENKDKVVKKLENVITELKSNK